MVSRKKRHCTYNNSLNQLPIPDTTDLLLMMGGRKGPLGPTDVLWWEPVTAAGNSLSLDTIIM